MTDEAAPRGSRRLARVSAAVRQGIALPPARWLFLAIALGVGFALGTWTRDPRAQLGTIGEWVSGLAIAAALVAVVVTLRRGHAERRDREARRAEEEASRRTALARAVGLRCRLTNDPRDGWFVAHLTIYNGGEHPIDGVFVVVPDLGVRDYYDIEHAKGTVWVVGVVLPRETLERDLRLPWPPDHRPGDGPAAYALFTDTWGRRWARAEGMLGKPDPFVPAARSAAPAQPARAR